MKRDLRFLVSFLRLDYNKRKRDRDGESAKGGGGIRGPVGGGREGEKRKREPGVTSMANARSRGNIPLTDVDKHCDREQGLNFIDRARRAIQRNRARNSGGRRRTGIRAGVLFFPGVVAASSTVYATTSTLLSLPRPHGNP